MARSGRPKRWKVTAASLVAMVGLGVAQPVLATFKYGPIELSGSVDSQTLLRSNEIDEWQFVQNRNTALLRLDYDWLQNGKFVDRYDVPFIKRSKLYMLYRGVYDSFWGFAPGGAQKGVTSFDDKVGGPIIGNTIGQTCGTYNSGTFGVGPFTPGACVAPSSSPRADTIRASEYSRITSKGRDALAWENTLREAYIDLALADAPVSFRLGRQQVIWGESDQFRLMDIINPLDTTWHLQQEEWDKLRIPLWLIKSIWDMGDIGPISNAFTEILWNPGDFQNGNKVEFLPAPWAVGIPDPTRAGQIQLPSADQTILLTPRFNLQGTTIRQGDFKRNPAEASEVGIRFHGVTDIPFINLQGFEFTANWFYGRARGIGAVAGAPFGLKINKVTVPDRFVPSGDNVLRQDPNDPTSPAATFRGRPGTQARPVFIADVDAEYVMPYTNIFGATANYFEGNFTNTVFRLETAYQLGAPYQSAFVKDRPHVVNQSGDPQPQLIPLGFTKRDTWAGMVGFDRPTWIKFLNPRTTWFITGQLFWSYVNGSWSKLRGGVLTAGENPYFNPPPNNPLHNELTNGVGQWNNGPFAGQTERVQNADLINGNADKVLQWEMLMTLAATSFYAGGTIVPFFAIAIDPMNRNFLAQLKLDYFLTNDLIIQLRENFYNDLGSGRTSLDPWGAGGLNARRDETGIKITFQF